MDANQLFFKFCVYLPVVLARGQNVPAYLRRLLESQYLSPHKLEALQTKKLQRIISSAKRSVPFYGRTLANVPAEAVRSLSDLRRLPFTTKADLKEHSGAISSRDRLYMLTTKTTGGSTGEPVTIHKTRNAMAWELAATWRGYSWAGIDIGDRQGRFWGVPLTKKDKVRARLIDFIANRRRCSAFSFGESDLQTYTEMLAAFRPTYFYGYVSMIEEYAKYFQRRCLIPPFALKCVVTTSEVLTDYHRNLIASVFGTRVFDEYGSGELGSVAHECEEGSMHVSAENMVVEVICGDRPCQAGETGELVVTELNNCATPLIRYRTGDFASLSAAQCGCGRTLPVIRNLFGRTYDALRNSEGKVFHGEFIMYVFEEAHRRNLGIKAFQVIQEDLRTLRIRLVPDQQYGRSTEDFIAHQIKANFDRDVGITFERVDRIERAPSGKKRLIVGMDIPSQP
jgi:phenylacetate-CoA ligase